MKVLVQTFRLLGVDQLHIGGMGKLVGGREEVHANYNVCNYKMGVKPVLGVCSGGLHPGIVHRIMDLVGTDIALQAGGGVHSHPGRTFGGARALRQAIDAYMEGVSVKGYSRKHKELRLALQKWGNKTFR